MTRRETQAVEQGRERRVVHVESLRVPIVARMLQREKLVHVVEAHLPERARVLGEPHLAQPLGEVPPSRLWDRRDRRARVRPRRVSSAGTTAQLAAQRGSLAVDGEPHRLAIRPTERERVRRQARAAARGRGRAMRWRPRRASERNGTRGPLRRRAGRRPAADAHLCRRALKEYGVRERLHLRAHHPPCELVEADHAATKLVDALEGESWVGDADAPLAQQRHRLLELGDGDCDWAGAPRAAIATHDRVQLQVLAHRDECQPEHLAVLHALGRCKVCKLSGDVRGRLEGVHHERFRAGW